MRGQIFLDGTWLAGAGRIFTSINPANDQPLWQGAAAAPADVDRAARAAREAFESWGRSPLPEREAVVRRFAKLLEEHRETLALTIARETGKPLWDSRTEIAAMIGKIDISIRAYHARTGTTESQAGGVRQALRHKPHGVVAVFGPYNFPGHLPNGHIVPALIAGNCVLFKPSELTPLVAEQTVELWEQAGLPSGVLNLLQGERATGEALAAHADLDGLYFTGSAKVGHLLHKQYAAQPHKILALEMGGNNPLIVGAIGDVRAAVHDVLLSAYLSSGQRCTCARRLFVPTAAAGDRFLAALTAAVRALRVGAAEDPEPPFMGPLISRQAAQQLLDAQKKLLKLGARPLVEMRRLERGEAFVTPALIDATGVKGVADEEHFGPLLKVYRYDALDDAITQANATAYGLSAGLLSDAPGEYEIFYRRIRAGIVNWNRPITGASSAAPFGGVGQSGNHRPSAFYAADYCAYPVASMEAPKVELPAQLSPGITLPAVEQ